MSPVPIFSFEIESSTDGLGNRERLRLRRGRLGNLARMSLPPRLSSRGILTTVVGNSAKKKPKKGEDWNSDASASASEPDLSSGSDSDAPVAFKKSKSKTAAVVASKRAGLRGPRKGLMAPLAIEERGDKGEVSDLSDEEMEE